MDAATLEHTMMEMHYRDAGYSGPSACDFKKRDVLALT